MKSISLAIAQMGHVPSFKNKKRAIIDRKRQVARLITEPETKAWIDKCIESFVSQLCSKCQTTGDGTQTERSPLSLIASSMPADDSWREIPSITIDVIKVPLGQEGAVITIENWEQE